MPLSPGSRIGSHVVVSLIGQGGMGEVYKARDTTLNRDVAIKRLPDTVATDPERLARFEREARTLAALNHPNVAQVYAVESGTIVMELVDGETLGGPLPLDTALQYAAQIAAALEAAHEKGIVHRDLKPGNVMITADGVIKVLDFSLAARERAIVDGDPMQSPTITGHTMSAGMILGTAAYMSPEQASGKPVDKRADIFAFGVVLWEMLTGRRMFEGETISHVLASVLTKEPDLTAVPPRVRHLLARCLEKDPKKRLRDIGDAMSLVLPASEASAGDVPVRVKGLPVALTIAGWVAATVLAGIVAALLWSRPAPTVETSLPATRFQIPRAQDLYNQSFSAFAVSPDGRTLAYYDASDDGRQSVFLRTLATGDVREIEDARTLSPRSSLFWSPDSTQLVYGAAFGAFVVNAATGAVRALCECRFTGGSWNRDGVILLGANGAGPISRMTVTDSRRVEITDAHAASGERDWWPTFLPDGQRFLFTRAPRGETPATYVGSLGGGPPRKVADGSLRVVLPAAVGQRSYLVGIDRTGVIAQPFDLDTLAAAGAAITLVPGGVSVSAAHNGVMATSAMGSGSRTVPTWFDRKGVSLGAAGDAGFIEAIALSRDGRKLVISETPERAPGSNLDLWMRDLEKGVKTRLTFNPAGDNAPVWSPDGSRIAYTSMRAADTIYQRAADGTGNETPLFTIPGVAWPNDWSSDGRWLIFTRPKPSSTGDNDIWYASATEELTSNPASYLVAPGRQQQAEFSPDGRFVVYGSEESGTFEIYVQPFPDESQGKWMVSSGGGAEPRWSRDGTELFYFSGHTLMSVPVKLKPTFAHGVPVALFDAPIQAGYINDGDRWQVAPDGKRFLLLAPAGQQQGPPLEVIVNWPALVKPD